MLLFCLLSIAFAIAILIFYLEGRLLARRLRYIEAFTLPPGLFDKLRNRHPHLNPADYDKVALGLKQFFVVQVKNRRTFIAMPSQVVDDLWHEFILHTRCYQTFCKRAFGRFLHHSPASALKQHQMRGHGIRRAWRYACEEEKINPAKPDHLPLLFVLDAQLSIASGFAYALDCDSTKSQRNADSPYCGSDLAVYSFDGTGGCGGDSSADGSCGGCGSGCGGCSGNGCGGCAGGCGGD